MLQFWQMSPKVDNFWEKSKLANLKKKQNTNVPILKDIPIQIQKVSKISPTEF